MFARCCIIVFVLSLGVAILADEAQELKPDDENYQGLYSNDDKVEIMTMENFNGLIYNQNHAWIVEFYNSWCGFCQRFAPEWKQFAADINIWRHIVRVGAIDCANDANNDICRNFEVMAYPTIRFFHESYPEKNGNIGDKMEKGGDAKQIREILVTQLRSEQEAGRGLSWPALNLNDFHKLADVWFRIPKDIKVTFLIFENVNSSIGSEVILDMDNVFGIRVLRVNVNSTISKLAEVTRQPSLVVLKRDSSVIPLTPKEASRETFRKAILIYLQSNKFTILQTVLDEIGEENAASKTGKQNLDRAKNHSGNVVYQADLETALRYTLHHEITNHKVISDQKLEALRNYVSILDNFFPFTANGKRLMSSLKHELESRDSWEGKELSAVIEKLESEFWPVYSGAKEWIGCKGSAPHLRGFTCGLWTMFHTLTVNSALSNTDEVNGGGVVLSGIHGYVKYFFGCADCSEHFQSMAETSKMSEAQSPESAVIWLWRSHNEVNARLAGDQTEDPMFPKKQFPPPDVCPSCRRHDGYWNINATFDFLTNMYGVKQINLLGAASLTRISSSLDVRYLGILYMLSVLILLLITKIFVTKRFYRKKKYRHDNLGKV